MDLNAFVKAVVSQDEAALAGFFHKEARVRWPNTGEAFTVSEYIRVNCRYPGTWEGQLLRTMEADGSLVAITRLKATDGSQSLHAISFFTLREGLIIDLEEYWSDDGPPPPWRQQLLSKAD